MADADGPRLYSCYKCHNHVALHDDIVSKYFQAKNGRAFLFSCAMNVVAGPKEDRQLMTGLHTVADVHCSDCREVLGWKYERAYEESQKYKEGKVVLEKFKIVKDNWVYCCLKCRNVLAIQDDIVDKDFVYGSHRAFLFSHAINVVEGPAMGMLLLSGQLIIADVGCSDCGEKVGWKYIKCYQQDHLHKLGKTVLVKSKIGKLSNPPFH